MNPRLSPAETDRLSERVGHRGLGERFGCQ